MNTINKDEQLLKIRNEIFAFENSPLYQYRKSNNYFAVLGEGDHDAKIMFVGEAPGQNEAKTGRPFCGSAGKFLTLMIESIGLERKDVYITNLVKDRPPENRDPTEEEIKMYSPFLDRQIEVIRPMVIATLGRYSMAYILKKFGLQHELSVISKMHGHVYTVINSNWPLKIITLYHPAVALYNGSMRTVLINDFKIVKDIIDTHIEKLSNDISEITKEQQIELL